ncbi:MAG: extracellular solute-binding protein [Defluviitaleaceae bacterium]|nr:extracellular solute-binding protein [Defluviitaleaceae bacterium]
MKKFFKNVNEVMQRTPKKTKLIALVGIVLLLVLIIALVVTIIVRRRNNDIVTITYANWNLGSARDNALELRMIQSFMDMHPNIRVEIDQNITTTNWTDSLAIAASQNRLPDVFMLEDIGSKAANGWLMNITPHIWTDLDFFDLTSNVQEAMRINNIMYAVPFAQNIHGYFVNRDLLRDMGIDQPSFGISAHDFINAVRASTDLSRPTIGLNNAFSLVEWYPSAVNPIFDFFAYDGLGFALNSPEMQEAVRLAASLNNDGYTFDGIPYTGNFPAGNALGAFLDGQMAFFYGGSWNIDVMVNQTSFDWAFIGVPGGRSIITLEVLGIASSTNHPEEAYMLARWMSHGAEGSQRRLEYARDMGILPGSLPVSQSSYVLDELLKIMPAPGLLEIYQSIDRALIDGLRILPGYMQARFTAPTGVAVDDSLFTDIGVDSLIRYSIAGNIYFPDISYIAEEVARHQLDSAQIPFR